MSDDIANGLFCALGDSNPHDGSHQILSLARATNYATSANAIAKIRIYLR